MLFSLLVYFSIALFPCWFISSSLYFLVGLFLRIFISAALLVCARMSRLCIVMLPLAPVRYLCIIQSPGSASTSFVHFNERRGKKSWGNKPTAELFVFRFVVPARVVQLFLNVNVSRIAFFRGAVLMRQNHLLSYAFESICAETCVFYIKLFSTLISNILKQIKSWHTQIARRRKATREKTTRRNAGGKRANWKTTHSYQSNKEMKRQRNTPTRK